MNRITRCLTLFTACSLFAACSELDDGTKSTKPSATLKPAHVEPMAQTKKEEFAPALTTIAPTVLPSVADKAPATLPEPIHAPEPEPTKPEAAQLEEIDYDRALDPAEVKIARFVLAHDVKDREPVDASDTFTSDVKKIFAFVELENGAAPYAFNVHWESLDQAPSPYGVKLGVKTSPRFRTWAWTAVKRSPGAYRAVLRTLDGKDIASRSFVIEAAETGAHE